MADRVGQRLGSYRLIRWLGEGGFAEVYLGEHLHLGSQAAIKVLTASLSKNAVEGFREEARTIARLKHPHIIRVLDFDIEQGTPFLVMEYAPGGTMRQRHPRGRPVLPSTILPYVQQIAGALGYAHEQKLIHRDIKPENLLLGRNQEVLVSDFSLAAIVSTRYEGPPNVAGTVRYMAPEQIQGIAHRASDQYGLGIVVYEWLTGAAPFNGSWIEIANQHLFKAPPPLRDTTPAIPPAVEQVVLTALAKDPAQRFATIQTFATALEQATPGGKPLAGRVTSLPPAPLAEPTRDPYLTRLPTPAPEAGPQVVLPERRSGPSGEQEARAIASPPAPAGVPSPGPTTRPAPKYGRKKVLALSLALLLIFLGGMLLAIAHFFLGNHPSGSATATATGTATAFPTPVAALTFFPGTPCSQGAPAQATTPTKVPYLTPLLTDHGQGSPAFVAVDDNGTLFYTDQKVQAIYGLSPALTDHNNIASLPGLSGKPGGLVSTPSQTARLYYLLQDLTSGGKPIERILLVDPNHSSTQLATLPDSGQDNYGLALNPTTKALLAPDGDLGDIYCLSANGVTFQPVVRGLKQPVAAVADTAGNVYVADQAANLILRFTPSGGSTPAWMQSFQGPTDLVVDSGGYLLATLQGSGPGQGSVVRIDPATGAVVDTLMAGLQQPRGITLDTSQYQTGTIYFTDQAANSIYAICTYHNAICL